MSIPFKARPLRGSDARRSHLGVIRSTASGEPDAHQLGEFAANLAANVEGLQREMAALRRDNEDLRAMVGRFAAQLEPALEPLRRANDALVVVAEIVEQQRIQEIEDREELRQMLQAQRQEQGRLAEIHRSEQPRLARQLAAIETGDSRIVAGVEARTHELAHALEQWQDALRRQFEVLREGLGGSAALDREATLRLTQTGEQIRAVQEEVSRQLLGLNRTMQEINQATLASVAEDEARANEACREEAVRLNRIGLQHLARGNPEAAARFFAEAHAQAADSFEPRLNLAVALLQSGRVTAAAQLAGELASAFPGRPEIGWVRGVAKLALGDIESARADLASVPGTSGEREELTAAAGLAHLLGGDGRAALEALGAAARRRSHEGGILREAGFEPGESNG